MKKSLLVISVILLIAGLFISCNSEAAGSADNLATVKFADDSKALNTTTEGPVLPILDNLYWYYQATKTSVGGNSGQTTGWTRVNNTKGLAGTIGPFSLGNWSFELAAVATETEPTTDNKVYWGNANVTLSRGSNTVTVDLHTHVSSDSTVKLNEVLLLVNDVPGENVTWYWSAFLDDISSPAIAGVIDMSETGAKTTDSDMTVASNVSSGNHSITITVFDSNDESANAVFSASKDFIAFPGATIIVSGSLEELTADVEFEPGSIIPDTDAYEAYVLTNSIYRYYETLEAAIAAAAAGDTVGLLKDVSLSGCSSPAKKVFLIDKSVTIEGNNKTLTLTNTGTDKTDRNTGLLFSNCSYYRSGDTTAADGDLGTKTWTISNLTIVGNDMLRTILVDSYCIDDAERSSLILENVVINSNCECLYANGESNVVANNCTFNSTNTSGKSWTSDSHPVYKSAVMVGYGSNITLNGCNVESDYNCLGVFPSGGGTVATNNCEITSSNTSEDYAAIYVTNDNYTTYPFCTDSVIKIATGSVTGNVILRGKNQSTDASNHHSYFAIAPGVEFAGQIKAYDYTGVDYNLWSSTSVETGYTWYTVRPDSVESLDGYTRVNE